MMRLIGIVRPQLLNVKVLNSKGRGTEKNLVDGLLLAIQRDVDMVNLSAGIPRTGFRRIICRGTCRLCRAALAADSAGILVHTAAGNDRTTHCPATAALMHPKCNIKAVAALDPETGQQAEYSAQGNAIAPAGKNYLLPWPPNLADILGSYVTFARGLILEMDATSVRVCCYEGLSALPDSISNNDPMSDVIYSCRYELQYMLGRSEFVLQNYSLALMHLATAENFLMNAVAEGARWLSLFLGNESYAWPSITTRTERIEFLIGTVREMIGRTLLMLNRNAEAKIQLLSAADSIRNWPGQELRLRDITEQIEAAQRS